MITCAACGRTLTTEATLIAGLPFGPECRKRAMRLGVLLTSLGLELPVTLEMVPSDDGFFRVPPALLELERRARSAGLTLQTSPNWGEQPTLTVSLKADRGLRAAIRNPRAEFEAKAKLAGVVLRDRAGI